MSLHEEPWTATGRTVRDAGGHCVAMTVAATVSEGESSRELAALTSRRIAACVTACTGIPLEVLEAMRQGGRVTMHPGHPPGEATP